MFKNIYFYLFLFLNLNFNFIYSCSIEYKKIFRINEKIEINLVCEYIIYNITIFPKLKENFYLKDNKIYGISDVKLSKIKYEVIMEGLYQKENKFFEFEVKNPICNYNIQSNIILRRNVFYEIKPPICDENVIITSNKLPDGLYIHSDNSISGVVTEIRNEINSIIFFYSNTDKYTFKFKIIENDLENYLQVYTILDNPDSGGICENKTNYLNFFNGRYEQYINGPYYFNTSTLSYNYMCKYDNCEILVSLNGFIYINEEDEYLFQGYSDFCAFASLNYQLNNILYTYGVENNDTIYLNEGYYPIYILNYFGNHNGRFSLQMSSESNNSISTEYTKHNNDAIMLQNLYYDNLILFNSVDDKIIVFPSFDGLSTSFTLLTNNDDFTISNSGKVTGEFKNCPDIKLIVVKGETNTSSSITGFTVVCGNPIINKILVTYYYSDYNRIYTSYINPLTNDNYWVMLKRYSNSLDDLDERLFIKYKNMDNIISNEYIIEWKGKIKISDLTCKIKLDCNGSCYLKIDNYEMSKFNNTVTEPILMKYNGILDFYLIYYGNEINKISLQYSIDSNEYKDLDENFQFYNECDNKAKIVPTVLYVNYPGYYDVIIGLNFIGINPNDISSISITPYLFNGLYIGKSYDKYIFGITPNIDINNINYTITANINGYKISTSISLGVSKIEEKRIIYPNNTFINNHIGEEIYISPENYNNDCNELQIGDKLPEGIMFNNLTGEIYGKIESLSKKSIIIYCYNHNYFTITEIPVNIRNCEKGMEYISVSITVGPDPSLFHRGIISNTNQLIFINDNDIKPYDTISITTCVNDISIFSVYSDEIVKGNYTIKNENENSYISAGIYDNIFIINHNKYDFSFKYETDELLFYNNIENIYFPIVNGSGIISVNIEPEFDIPGLNINEYGIISGKGQISIVKEFNITATNFYGMKYKILITIIIKNCDLVYISIYFPFVKPSIGMVSENHNGIFKLKSESKYYIYQIGAIENKDYYNFCVIKGNYSLLLSSKDNTEWKDNYIKMFVNNEEYYNEIFSGGNEKELKCSLNKYISEISLFYLKYTDYVLDDSWIDIGVNESNCLNYYYDPPELFTHQYIVTRYYSYSFILDINNKKPLLFRISITFQTGIAFYINGKEMFRKFLPYTDLNRTVLSINPIKTDMTIDLPMSIIKDNDVNVISIESHLSTRNKENNEEKGRFYINSFLPIYSSENCYVYTLTDFKLLTSTSEINTDYPLNNIFDGIRSTYFYGSSDNITIHVKLNNYLISFNGLALIYFEDEDYNHQSIYGEGIVNNKKTVLVKETPIKLEENSKYFFINSKDTNIPFDEFSITFKSDYDIKISDLVLTYCSLFCQDDTLIINGRTYFFPSISYEDTQIISCGNGYEGSITRLCNKEGKWEEPNINCNVIINIPKIKYPQPNYYFVRGDNTITTGIPIIEDVISYSFEITPNLSELSENLEINSNGEITGVLNINKSYEHVMNITFTIRCINYIGNVYGEDKINIIVSDPKCDDYIYVNEYFERKCNYSFGYKKIRCNYIDGLAQLVEDESDCFIDRLSCLYQGTKQIIFYPNIYQKSVLYDWHFKTDSCFITCYDNLINLRVIQCPTWLSIDNNCTITGIITEKFNDFYLTITPTYNGKSCTTDIMTVITGNEPNYKLSPLQYYKEEYIHKISDGIVSIIPIQSIQADFCISFPELPENIILEDYYTNHLGIITFNNPRSISNGTYRITCGYNKTNTTTVISLRVISIK